MTKYFPGSSYYVWQQNLISGCLIYEQITLTLKIHESGFSQAGIYGQKYILIDLKKAISCQN